jgi:hypothetical protein
MENIERLEMGGALLSDAEIEDFKSEMGSVLEESPKERDMAFKWLSNLAKGIFEKVRAPMRKVGTGKPIPELDPVEYKRQRDEEARIKAEEEEALRLAEEEEARRIAEEEEAARLAEEEEAARLAEEERKRQEEQK